MAIRVERDGSNATGAMRTLLGAGGAGLVTVVRATRGTRQPHRDVGEGVLHSGGSERECQDDEPASEWRPRSVGVGWHCRNNAPDPWPVSTESSEWVAGGNDASARMRKLVPCSTASCSMMNRATEALSSSVATSISLLQKACRSQICRFVVPLAHPSKSIARAESCLCFRLTLSLLGMLVLGRTGVPQRISEVHGAPASQLFVRGTCGLPVQLRRRAPSSTRHCPQHCIEPRLARRPDTRK